jgi:beta-lactamase class A
MLEKFCKLSLLVSTLALGCAAAASAGVIIPNAMPNALPGALDRAAFNAPHGAFQGSNRKYAGNGQTERTQTDPTAYWYGYGQTAAGVDDLINKHNARIVDIQVDHVGSQPYFTVSLVANTGKYAKTWWWWHGVTASQLNANLSQNNARLISVTAYQSGNDVHFAAVAVSNTGNDAKGWWWVYGTPSYVQNTIGGLQNARVVDLENYQYNGSTQYAAIAIANTGSDASAWWWYFGVDGSSINGLLSKNNAQPLTVVNDGSKFDVVMQGCPCAYNWYYYGADATHVGMDLNQNGARPTMLRSYTSGSSRRFDVVMINNSNAVTTRIGSLMRSASKGWTGFYLKQVGARSALGALDDARIYEPASSIKIVMALYAMEQIEANNLSLNSNVPRYDANNYCNFQQNGTETVKTAITQMMQNSDNARADMFMKKFGLSTLTSFAHHIGMPNTATNAYINCGPFTNQFTLDDAAHLYENLVQGNYITQTDVGVLANMMAGKNYDFSGMYAGMQTIVTQEAAAYHLTSAQIASYENGIALSQKSGGYWWPGGVPSYYGDTMYRSNGNDGWAVLPYCSGAQKHSKTYVFGFFYEEDQPGQPDGLVWNQMLAGAETLREQIRSGLQHWSQCG